MPEVEYTTTMNAPPELVWDFVKDMNVDRQGDVPVPLTRAKPAEPPPTARCSRGFTSSEVANA